MRIYLVMIIILLCWYGTTFAQDDPLDGDAMSETFYTEFNRILREQLEAPALARNETLDAVAQQIATQIGCTDERIEFNIQTEVQERGYETYPGDSPARTTRIPLLPVVNIRPIEEMAQFYTENIYGNNISQPGRMYREIGVGVSPCFVTGGSTQQYGLFVILGAQPDVIPVIIENGAGTISTENAPLEVTLSIHEENSRPREGIFGTGASMRLSSEPLTEDDEAQDFSFFVDWELSECGDNTVYYELIDEAGLTVEGESSVELVCTSE